MKGSLPGPRAGSLAGIRSSSSSCHHRASGRAACRADKQLSAARSWTCTAPDTESTAGREGTRPIRRIWPRAGQFGTQAGFPYPSGPAHKDDGERLLSMPSYSGSCRSVRPSVDIAPRQGSRLKKFFKVPDLRSGVETTMQQMVRS